MTDLLELLRRKNLLGSRELRLAREWLQERKLPQDDVLPALVALGFLSPAELRDNLEELSDKTPAARSPAEEEDLFLLGVLVRQRLIGLDRLTRCLDHKRALEGTNRTRRIHEILLEDGALTIPQLAALLEPTGRRLLDCHHCGNLEIVQPREGNVRCPRCGSERDLNLESPGAGATTARRRPQSDILAEPELPQDPERVGPYQVQELLGKGATGVVYRGEDPQTGKTVAIKFLSGALGIGPRSRFHREARILAALDHPGIVRVHGLGQEGRSLFLILDYVPGRTLDRYVAAVQPDLAARVAIFRQVAEAIAYAHARGIVHRDIKPSNILVDEAGVPHLTDFGLAKRVGLDALGRVTDSGELLGTPYFMAPEQVSGEGEEASEATDQYALGVLLYQLLAGKPPYQATSVAALFKAIEETVPEPPSRRAPEVPWPLDLVCLKAMQKDPGDRFPSVAAMVEEVRRWQRGLSVRVALPKRRSHLARLAEARPALFWAALAGVLLLVGLAGIGLYAVALRMEWLRREQALAEKLLELRRRPPPDRR